MPNDLISRSALLPAIESYFEPINPDHPMTLTIEQIREVLNLLPAVDAAEVVRCRECKDYCPASDGQGGEMHYGFCINRHDETCRVTRNRYERDFCSYGKRKDGDSNDE